MLSDQSIHVYYSEPESGSEVTGYEYRYRAESQPWTEVTDIDLTTESIRITGLTPLTRYHVQVRAISAQGTSEWSEQDSATTRSVPTPTPTPRPTATPTPTYPDTHVVLAPSGAAIVSQLEAEWEVATSVSGNINHYGYFSGGYYIIEGANPPRFAQVSDVRPSNRDISIRRITLLLQALGYTEQSARAIATAHINTAASREWYACNTPSQLQLYSSLDDNGLRWTTIEAVSGEFWESNPLCT